MLRQTWTVAVLGLTAMLLPSLGQAAAVYQIGNSLTWDSQPHGIDALVGGHDYGFHIRCSSSLTTITGDPITTCVTSPATYGKYTEALPGFAWDAVTLQVYRDGQTYSQDVAAATNLINLAQTNPANAGANFYLYQTWARRSDPESWLADNDLTLADKVVNTREGMQLMVDQVRAATTANVYVIPTAEVFYALAQAINNGDIEGLTSFTQLYRDDQHASYDLGRYAAGLTAYATIYGTENIETIAPPLGYYQDSNAIWTPEVITGINSIVASVVSSHADAVAIPEPASGLMVLGLGLLVGRRRRVG